MAAGQDKVQVETALTSAMGCIRESHDALTNAFGPVGFDENASKAEEVPIPSAAPWIRIQECAGAVLEYAEGLRRRIGRIAEQIQ